MYENANFSSTALTTLQGASELWRFIEKVVAFGDSIKRMKREYFRLTFRVLVTLN